jgi:hypothetical protein
MSDDLEQSCAPYSHRVDVKDEEQVDYWTNRLGVTTAALVNAVEQVGSDADKVAIYLGKPARVGTPLPFGGALRLRRDFEDRPALIRVMQQYQRSNDDRP